MAYKLHTRNWMKVLILSLIVLMAFQSPMQQAGIVYADSDVTKPVLNSVEVDKKEANLGEQVTVSVDAQDSESGIDRVVIWYDHPSSDRHIYKSIRPGVSEGAIQAVIDVTNELEEGLYQLDSIVLYDKAGNDITFYNTHTNPSYRSNLMDMSSGDFTVKGTTADITKPVLDTVEVDKRVASLGEKVTVSVGARDSESGIDRVVVWYDHPSSDRHIYKSIRPSDSEVEIQAVIDVTNDLEEGLYQLDSIVLYDKAGNSITYYNTHTNPSYRSNLMDMSSGDFTVKGTTADITKPVLDTVQVDKKVSSLGEKVTVSVGARDSESGIDRVVVWYDHPGSDRHIYKSIRPSDSGGEIQAVIDVTNDLEEGLYQLDSIVLYDKVGNTITYYNTHTNPSYRSNLVDMSSGNFRVDNSNVPANPLLEENEVVYYSQTWNTETINSDVYVGPDSTLTIDGDVTINGDVYVMGVLNNYGDLTINGKITAMRYLWGTTSTSPGTVNMLGGTNSISHQVATSRILSDIPFTVTTQPLISNNGLVDIEGAVLPVVSMSIEGDKIPLNYNGTFSKKEINVGDKETLNVQFTDIFGNVIEKDSPLQIIDTIDPTVLASIEGGYFASDKEVELTMSERGQIYYTLNGETPDKTSTKYEGPLTITENTTLKAIGYDKVGNPSEVLTEVYSFLKVDEVTEKTKVIIGNAKPHSTVTVKGEQDEWSTKADGAGEFQVSIPLQSAGTVLTIYAVDSEGTQSETVKVEVKDTTPPSLPEVDEITDQSTALTGSTEAGAAVTVFNEEGEIGRGEADAAGQFSIAIPVQKPGEILTVTATDASGNASEAVKVTVKDITAPAAPEIHPVTDQSTQLQEVQRQVQP